MDYRQLVSSHSQAVDRLKLEHKNQRAALAERHKQERNAILRTQNLELVRGKQEHHRQRQAYVPVKRRRLNERLYNRPQTTASNVVTATSTAFFDVEPIVLESDDHDAQLKNDDPSSESSTSTVSIAGDPDIEPIELESDDQKQHDAQSQNDDPPVDKSQINTPSSDSSTSVDSIASDPDVPCTSLKLKRSSIISLIQSNYDDHYATEDEDDNDYVIKLLRIKKARTEVIINDREPVMPKYFSLSAFDKLKRSQA